MLKDKKNIVGSFEDMKCIWMAGNLVDYKLCDKGFDCENCPFDKVMRNFYSEKIDEMGATIKSSGRKDILAKVVDKLSRLEYNEKLIYLKNKFILKHLFNETYYLGINPLLLLLLDNITSVEYLNSENYVAKSKKMISINGNWGSITLKSPVNILLIEKLNFMEASYSDKWLALAGVNTASLGESRLSKEKWEEQKSQTIKMLEKFSYSYPEVGPTLPDGGENLSFIYQVIGKDEYLDILNSFAE
jgi:glycine cleavage system H lipoate-binding protein